MRGPGRRLALADQQGLIGTHSIVSPKFDVACAPHLPAKSACAVSRSVYESGGPGSGRRDSAVGAGDSSVGSAVGGGGRGGVAGEV
jgi:hypothetical protein